MLIPPALHAEQAINCDVYLPTRFTAVYTHQDRQIFQKSAKNIAAGQGEVEEHPVPLPFPLLVQSQHWKSKQ